METPGIISSGNRSGNMGVLQSPLNAFHCKHDANNRVQLPEGGHLGIFDPPLKMAKVCGKGIKHDGEHRMATDPQADSFRCSGQINPAVPKTAMQ